MGTMDFDFKIALYLFFWVSVFALLGVLNLLKYSLFFRNYLSKFVFFWAFDFWNLLFGTSRRF